MPRVFAFARVADRTRRAFTLACLLNKYTEQLSTKTYMDLSLFTWGNYKGIVTLLLNVLTDDYIWRYIRRKD